MARESHEGVVRTSYDVVMLVMNGIESDSRVLRTARSVYEGGLSVLLLGLGKPRPDGDLVRVRVGGPDAFLIPAPKLPAAESGTPAQGERHRSLLTDYEQQVLDICGDMSPRVIHSHDMTTIAAGGRLKREFARRGRDVAWIHDLHEWVGGLTTIPDPIREVSADDERRWIHDADALTTVSPDIARVLAEEHGLESEPIVVLNTPPLSDYNSELSPTAREVIGLADEVPLAVYSGQVKEARGVHDLVRALKHAPGLHVAIISNNRGPYVDHLTQLAASDGTLRRMHMIGYVDQRDVASFMRSANVGVHPLTRYGNGDVALPNKLFEYVHAALPVVVSDCRAMAEFVAQHDIGFSYPSGDAQSLAAAIERAMSDGERLRHNCESIRARYSWEQQEAHIHDIYAGLLGVGSISRRPPFRWPAPEGVPPAGEPIRVLHGLAGSANQPWTLAAALRRRGHRAVNVATSLPRFGFRANLMVPWGRMDMEERFRLIRALADEFQVFHFHARSFFFERGSLRFPTLVDLLLLRLLGKVVVFHFRGTEARIASEFAALSPYNYVASDPYRFSDAFPERLQRRMITFIGAIANAVYVPDPELGFYVPGSEVIPRAIDLNGWPAIGVTESERPMVVHAPTRGELKGTAQVLEAIERLRAEGHDFEFALVENLPHAQARTVYERADVIVDQLLIGWYGVLAVEGMALGKAVVSYVRPDLVRHLGSPLPLAVADPSSIEDVLRELITDVDRRRALGTAARAYAERVHGADAVAASLEERYRALLADAEGRGADYDGVAAFLEIQAAYADETAVVMGRASRLLRAAETTVSDATPHAKRALRELAMIDASTANKHAAPAFSALAEAERKIVAARALVEEAIGVQGSGVEPAELPSIVEVPAAPASGPVEPPEPPSVVAAPEPPISAPVEPAPVEPAPAEAPRREPPPRDLGPGSSGAPSVEHVVEFDRWGIASTLRKLTLGKALTWEQVADEGLRDPATGLALFDDLLHAPPEPERDAVAVRLATATARACERRDGALIARLPSSGKRAAVPVDVKDQVRLARHFHSLRRMLGDQATVIGVALLRAVLARIDPTDPTPYGSGDAEGTYLNDLSWFFINTARLSTALDGSDVEAYAASLQWFAERTNLWSVERFETTRSSLNTTLPLRWAVGPSAGAGDPQLRVRVRDSRTRAEMLRRYDPASGRLEAIETTVSVRITDAARIPVEISARRALTAVVSVPRHRFDPLRSTPSVERWEPLHPIHVDRAGVAVTLEIPGHILKETRGLTAFQVVDGRYVSRTLDRQIEQMQTLSELHPGHGFEARASQWAGFRNAWALRRPT